MAIVLPPLDYMTDPKDSSSSPPIFSVAEARAILAQAKVDERDARATEGRARWEANLRKGQENALARAAAKAAWAPVGAANAHVSECKAASVAAFEGWTFGDAVALERRRVADAALAAAKRAASLALATYLAGRK